LVYSASYAQLKFIVEDFEGFTDGNSGMKQNGIFTYGDVNVETATKLATGQHYSGNKYLEVSREGKLPYGGWGKGIGLHVQLDVTTDFLNFYVFQPSANTGHKIKIDIEEDDSGNSTFEKDQDDAWTHTHTLDNKSGWQLVSIPLSQFRDSNTGGDHVFNISYADGKIFSLTFSLPDSVSTKKQSWGFDFICFSKGKLVTGQKLFDAPTPSSSDICSLGAWSKEGNEANFTQIPAIFEGYFKNASEKKLAVVHFFQPFGFEGDPRERSYPSTELINKVIHRGYIPMITLENHFVNTSSSTRQPNLYSITEGHFDSFFRAWARQIRQVKGVVLLRILHEFNGDWYPWCVVNNDKNPELLIQAYHRIYNIFKEERVKNVRFIWCPNSMSVPQEKWNFIMSAYPGNDYVDYIGLDIYNGAGKGVQPWRSFRKEGMENYFLLTEQFPNKPLLICETASRERKPGEGNGGQDKAGWIKQMSETLTSDMSKVRLLTWFNERDMFRIDSSPQSVDAFLQYVLKNDYFKSGTGYLEPLLGK
jgi:hypothetical protein